MTRTVRKVPVSACLMGAEGIPVRVHEDQAREMSSRGYHSLGSVDVEGENQFMSVVLNDARTRQLRRITGSHWRKKKKDRHLNLPSASQDRGT